ncbi:orotidine-5'-phosphate decarboxylase [Pediococcus argentinicus]|uniref:orotidine-5'-phosphate decarboxylase n=1 Tax=Pediococcus argentinicus TaxID=480391 RepID=UPI0033907294
MKGGKDVEPVIIALDYDNQDQMNIFLDSIQDLQPKPIVKIGMELFYQYGPPIVQEVQERGFKMFLDLKLNDIPNTVERAMTQIAKLGPQLTTVHALGGKEMMEAAVRGANAGAKISQQEPPQILAVTELTSISTAVLRSEQNVRLEMSEQVTSLTQLAKDAGVAGVICSAQDLAAQEVLDSEMLYITPGIRPLETKQDDQSRVVTPTQARKLGSNAIVVGRPITKSEHPLQAYQQIFKEWKNA